MKLSVAAIAFFLVNTVYAQNTRKPEFDVAAMKAEATLGPGEVFRANLGTIVNGKVTLSADDAVVGPGRIVSPRMPMAVLANLLSRFERNIFIDLTELKGPFTINLQWTPDSMRSLAPRDGGPILVNGQIFDPNGPSLPTALQEQLGLRLESRRDPIDVIVVDSAEKIPTENE